MRSINTRIQRVLTRNGLLVSLSVLALSALLCLAIPLAYCSSDKCGAALSGIASTLVLGITAAVLIAYTGATHRMARSADWAFCWLSRHPETQECRVGNAGNGPAYFIQVKWREKYDDVAGVLPPRKELQIAAPEDLSPGVTVWLQWNNIDLTAPASRQYRLDEFWQWVPLRP